MTYLEQEEKLIINDAENKFLWAIFSRYGIVLVGSFLAYISWLSKSYLPLSFSLLIYVAAYNLIANLVYIWPKKQRRLWQVLVLSGVFQLFDIVAITFLIYITGWIESPYWFLYLVMIIIAGFGMFSYYSFAVFIIAFFSAALYFGLLVSAYLRILPIYGPDFNLSSHELLLSIYNKAIFMSVAFLLFASTVYYFSQLLNQQRSELSQKNQKLKEALDKIRTTDRLKDDFISTASHELRRPLSVIRENMALIRDGIVGDTDARQKKLLETSLLNADRLSKTLDNLLDISKIQSRSLKLEKKRTDIVQLALRAIALLDSASQQKNIDIKTNFSGGIELELDPELVTIVFVNLIENAINNTPSNGKILVTIRDEGQEVAASVCDNGIGIPPSQVHKIFERFVQIIEENESSAKGAGLGLSICKGIVEMHGGQICFESPPTIDALNPGRGTKFIFTLRKAEQNGQ